MVLEDIIIKKRKDLEEMKRRFPLHRLRDAVTHAKRSPLRPLRKALEIPHRINLICEIKKASPSHGIIREDFQPLKIAAQYEAGGAAAISVLTEFHYFRGRPSYLRTVRHVTSLPILRKDFIFESYQIYETLLLEADAFLLIASILTEEELKRLITLGEEFGLDALVEVHSEEDLKKALDAGAKLLGINNRNLKTLEVNPHFSKKILPHIPKDMTVVVESGLENYEELMEYKSLGIHAFLVGTSLMKADNILEKMDHLLGRDQKWIKKPEKS